MPSARFFHLSDLHLALRPKKVDPLTFMRPAPSGLPADWALAWQSSYHPGALLSAVALLDAAARPDAVLVSGDVATSGDHHDLLIGSKVLRGRPSRGFFTPHPLAGEASLPANSVLPTIQHLPGVVWIPGNHDRYDTSSIPWAPGSRAFDEVVGWSPCAGQHGPRITGPHTLGANEQLVVLGIDATLDRINEQMSPPAGFLAEGIIRAPDLAELINATPAPARDRFIVWVVHWPPEFPRHLAKPLHGLQNEKDLLRAAKKAGVDLILSGHTHADTVYMSSVGIPVACCGSTSQTVSAKRHTLLELVLKRAGSLFSADVRRWCFDVATVQFVRRGGWRVAGGSVAKTP